jgi:hypothetical protein
MVPRVGGEDVLLSPQAKQVIFAHQAQHPLVVDYLPLSPQQGCQYSIATLAMVRYCQLL